jgi:hypothetical protein
MVTGLKNLGDDVGLRSLDEFVLDFDTALALGDEIQMVVVLVQFFILGAKDTLWGFQHGVHSLDDVGDDFVSVEILIGEQL